MKTNKLTEPLISIVIPSFNQGQFIEQTITSFLGQNYPNLELIIIDGGSTDNTPNIIEKYKDSISHYISEPDNGQAHAINKGFRVAKGDILAWLNSDDMYLPCTLSKVASIFGSSYNQPKLIYGGCLIFPEVGRTSITEFFPTTGYLPPNFDAYKLTCWDYIVQPSTFWSRKLWETVGELNESYHYGLDWDWFIRASRCCDFVPISDYLSMYRTHEFHKTGTGGLKRANELIKIIETYADDNWISAYKDVYKNRTSLKKGFTWLSKLRLNRLRGLFYPHLYLKHGRHRVEYAVSTLSIF